MIAKEQFNYIYWYYILKINHKDNYKILAGSQGFLGTLSSPESYSLVFADSECGIEEVSEDHNQWPEIVQFCFSPCELGSGKFSLGTRCITVVRAGTRPKAPNVTLLCKKRPW